MKIHGLTSTSARNPPPQNLIEESPPSLNLQLLGQLLPRQTPRWCNLSLTLWSLIALDTQRNPDLIGLAQFLEVIYWRAQGKVTEDEFSVLYSEWMKLDKAAVADNKNKKKQLLLNISIFRCLLLEKNYSESDLDLFIGILIHEINVRLLNTTINYVSKSNSGARTVPAFNLEVVTRKWLELSEELFFALDTPGYGALRFDEAFFFCCCLSVGFQGWNNEMELETDLSLTSMTAVTLQFMRDSGVHIIAQNQKGYQEGNLEIEDYNLSVRGTTATTTRGSITSQRLQMKQEITLPMFKRYLIQRNVGEQELSLLLQHVKTCIEKIARLARMSGAEDLYQACQPYEYKGSVIGSPKLFQEAVLVASGFQPSPSTQASTGNAMTGAASGGIGSNYLPSILLFLLSDGEKFLSGQFRAIEFDVEGMGFVMVEDQNSNNPNNASNNLPRDLANPLLKSFAANEELHENAKRLYAYYYRWLAADTHHPSSHHGNTPSTSTRHQMILMNPSDLLRDPTYQLIVSTLLHYKRMQHILNAGFYDFSLSIYGSNAVQQNVPPSTLSILAAGLLPTAQLILVEFGLSPEESVNANESTLMNNNPSLEGEQEETTAINLSVMKLEELNPTNGILPPPPVAPGRRQSVLLTSKENRLKQQSTLTEGEKKPSDNNIETIIPGSTTSTAGNPKSDIKSKTIPHYFKPTQTFIAKTVKEKKIESDSVENEEGIVDAPPDLNKSLPLPTPTNSLPRGSRSNDPDISIAKWQSLLNLRSNSASPPVMDASNSRQQLSSSQQKSQKERKDKGNSDSSVNPSGLILNEDESKLLAQLLITNNPQEQFQLIERLRNKVAALPLSESLLPSRLSEDSEDFHYPLPSPPPPANSTHNNNTSLLSPLSMSPPEKTRGSTSALRKGQQPQVPQQSNKQPQPNRNGEETFAFPTPTNPAAVNAAAFLNPASEASSSTAPSSIQELLQQGHNPGKYAQMLREILRKMSKDDSHVRLKSLEQVLQLGQNIVHQDLEEKKKKQQHQSVMTSPNHGEERKGGDRGSLGGTSPLSLPTSPFRANVPGDGPSNPTAATKNATDNHRNQSKPANRGFTSTRKEKDNTSKNSVNNSNLSGSMMSTEENGVARRISRAPGLMPENAEKKAKKAFGHPVNH